MSNIQNQIETKEYAPMAAKRVAVVIGRFQPPTKGHYKVIDKVKKFIRTNKNLGLEASPAVVIVDGAKSSTDKKRNPLTAEERQLFMKSSGQADGVNFFIAASAFDAFKMLREKGFEPIAIAAGSDRVKDYLRILDKYFTDPAGKKIAHHAIQLKRDEDAVETKSDAKEQSMDSTLSSLKDSGDIETDLVSGSLARRAVELGYEPEFAAIVGLENKPELAKKMYGRIATAIGV